MTEKRDTPLPSVVGDSYATRLGVALAFAIVVIVAFGAVISVQASATLEDDVAADMTALSDTQAGQLDAWLTTTRRDVRTTSRLPVFSEGTDTERQDRLEALIETDSVPPDVVAVHYVNTETGEIEASSNQQFVGVDAAEQGPPSRPTRRRSRGRTTPTSRARSPSRSWIIRSSPWSHPCPARTTGRSST